MSWRTGQTEAKGIKRLHNEPRADIETKLLLPQNFIINKRSLDDIVINQTEQNVTIRNRNLDDIAINQIAAQRANLKGSKDSIQPMHSVINLK